jgi:Na+/proline symporter
MIIHLLPQNVSFTDALYVAGKMGKLNAIDFSFDLTNRYSFWSGMIGGFFLMLSYFGTDQSQVQRYLTGKSITHSRLGLLTNGLVKVPMQFFILLLGAMVFVFYQFNSSPLNFNPAATSAVMNSPYAEAYSLLDKDHKKIELEKKAAQLYFAEHPEDQDAIDKIRDLNSRETAQREAAKELIIKADASLEVNDKDYVFIHFILNNLPRGLIGLLLAVILSAAMSSTASELNALAATTTMDLYKRNESAGRNEMHYVHATKWFTLGWGILAILVASIADLFDNLIQLVNIIGSIFYGNILGIFLLAFFVKMVKGNAVFKAAILTQLIIIFVFFMDVLPYLWLNLLGCMLVMVLAIIFQKLGKNK